MPEQGGYIRSGLSLFLNNCFTDQEERGHFRKLYCSAWFICVFERRGEIMGSGGKMCIFIVMVGSDLPFYPRSACFSLGLFLQIDIPVIILQNQGFEVIPIISKTTYI